MDNYINDFNKYLVSKDFSSNSVSSYLIDIKKFIDYLKKEYDILIEQTTKGMILTYLVNLQKEGKSTATISRNISSLKIFFNFLINNKVIANNPVIAIHSPKQIKKIPEILTIEQINSLLNLPDENSFKGSRDGAILELFYSSGIKVSELIKLEIKDINFSASFVYIDGKKERIIPLGKIAEERIKHYLNNYRSQKAPKESQYVFINFNGHPITRQGIWKILKFYQKKLDIGKELSPQILRNSFAVHLLNNGADLISVQKLLGHKNITATQIYLGNIKNKSIDVFKKTHPRA